MNRNYSDFRLASHLRNLEGWGSAAAGTVSKTLDHRIAQTPHDQVLRISLAGVRRLDVTFANAAIVVPVKTYLGLKNVCLIDLTDADVTENIAAAAERAGTPLTVWNDAVPQIIGLTPSVGLRDTLSFVLERGEVRSAQLAQAQRISSANAANKLKQLSEEGFVMRAAGTASSGGPEFTYRPVG